MPSRRRSRIRSISGNISDVQKRLRYLETRPAPSQLARKVVATQNIALRAIQPEVVADAAIVRRTLAPEAVISANLSVVGDPDGAAVATDNIQLEAVDTPQVADEAITNDKLAGSISNDKLDDIADDKIIGVSASKIGPDLLIDDQLDGISSSKLIGNVQDDQIDGISASKIGPDLIQDEQIDGISGEKIIGGVDGALIVDRSIEAIKINGVEASVIIGNIQADQIEPDSITEDQIATDGVGYDELQADSVGTPQIINGSVIDISIDDLAIQRRHIDDNVIIARMINAGAVETAKIQNDAVTRAKIGPLAVGNAELGTAAVSAVKCDASVVVTVNTFGAALSRVRSGGQVDIQLSTGSGSAQVAAGNHTHGTGGYTAAGSSGVPSHTHPISISSSASGGVHAGHSIPNNGSHSHTVSVSGTSGTPSTIKLKKEISDYAMLDVKNLLNLNLKRYKYKNQARNLQEGREWMYGYIAEEVEELGIREIVGYDENKEPNAINYGLLSTLVLELVKVQQTEIDSLKEEIQRLKEKI
jgi:hypothetical protein